MSNLNDMVVFATIVSSGSISAASRYLHLRKSTVSRRLALLEERLSVRLLERSTRSLNLTEAGAIYYEYCQRVANETAAAESAMGKIKTIPSGTIRISTTLPFSQILLGKLINEFLSLYEDIKIHTLVSDSYVDLIKEGIDLAIRLGPLDDSNLVAKKFAEVRTVLCASPSYLKKNGTPKTLRQLQQHSCIGYGGLGGQIHWPLIDTTGIKQIKLDGRFIVNNHLAAREAAIAGLGITLLPEFMCAEQIKDKSLKPILKNTIPPARDFYLVYPSHRHITASVKVFSEFMIEKFS